VEFGSDAIGGVINVVTAPPSRTPHADATLRAGQLGRSEATVDASDTFGNTGVRLSGGWRQVDRLTAVASTDATLDRVYDVRADVRHRAWGATTLRADAQFARERQRWPVGAGYNGFIDNYSTQGMAEALTVTGSGMYRARLFGQTYHYQYRQAAGGSPVAGTADSLAQRERLVRGLLSHTRLAGAHTIDAGVQLASRSIVAPDKVDGDRASDHVVEAFARDSWTRGSLLLTAGARGSRSSLWGGAFAPSIGAALQIAPAWRVRVNVARGFRAPSFKEIRYTFANAGAGYVIEGNPDLVPETSLSTEAGVTFAPDRLPLVVQAEVYRNTVDRLIDLRFSGNNPAGLQTYRNVNVARAVLSGAEVSAHAVIGAADLRFAYAWLRARDEETGEPLDRRVPHSARISFARTWNGLRGLLTDAAMHYTGEARVGDETQGALLAVDAQLRLPVSRSLEVSLGVNNLFDRRPVLWTPAYARQVFAGLRVRAGERR
jgi:outer membrane receptor for ferrienterochelin and colicins